MTSDPTHPGGSGTAASRRVLWRAGGIAAFGGTLVAWSSQAFTRISSGDVAQIGGMVVGLLIIGLGLTAPSTPGTPKATRGMLIIVLAIASLPISLGGLILGSIASVVGGAMLVGYVPLAGPALLNATPAKPLRRALAGVVDLVVAAIFLQILRRFVGASSTQTVFVLASWALSWTVVVTLPSVLGRWTTGRLIAATRLVTVRPAEGATTASATPADTAATILRETARGVLAVSASLLVARVALADNFRGWAGLATAGVILAGWIAVARSGAIDRLCRSSELHESIAVAESNQTDAAVNR